MLFSLDCYASKETAIFFLCLDDSFECYTGTISLQRAFKNPGTLTKQKTNHITFLFLLKDSAVFKDGIIQPKKIEAT